MIFVVCFVPLGMYLLLLAHLNRQSRPVMVSGVLDFIGILFAASGFLLFGGPAILTGLNESWRSFWLLGDAAVSRDSLLAQWQFWVFLSALYFVVVVAGCAWALGRQRRSTSIYNVEPATVETALEDICEQFGLSPLRSGDVFVFGPGLEPPPPSEAIQAPHALTLAPRTRLDRPDRRADEFIGQSAVLEIEAFRPLRHVTLRWEPGDSPLRTVLETELDRRLGLAGAPYHETGIWMTMAGYCVLGMTLFLAVLLLLRSIWLRG